MKRLKYTANTDGIDHINIYSKAKTTFGRTLSNFALTPFTHPKDGKFISVEGYWYWVLVTSLNKSLYYSNIQRAEDLRTLWGFNAKKAGKQLLPKEYISKITESTEFRDKIRQAFYAKIDAHTALQEWMVAPEFDLPFAHYYQYGDKVVEPTAHKWQIDIWENIRTKLKLRKGMDLLYS